MSLDIKLGEEGHDILRDLSQIAQLEEGSEESNENEAFLIEIMEFVRLAVFNIHLQLHSRAVPSQAAASSVSTH
jgi:uncharacterized protein YgfB (UPF0149 family)